MSFKVKGQGHQGQKRHFSVLLAACVRFMFDKTSLASSFVFDFLQLLLLLSLIVGRITQKSCVRIFVKRLNFGSDREHILDIF